MGRSLSALNEPFPLLKTLSSPIATMASGLHPYHAETRAAQLMNIPGVPKPRCIVSRSMNAACMAYGRAHRQDLQWWRLTARQHRLPGSYRRQMEFPSNHTVYVEQTARSRADGSGPTTGKTAASAPAEPAATEGLPNITLPTAAALAPQRNDRRETSSACVLCWRSGGCSIASSLSRTPHC